MKARTNDFKEAIKGLKEISSKITYTINGVATELGDEELNSVQPHYQGSLLKSIMKELDLDSNVDIPKETIINYQFGVLVNGDYEYINYGNYVVYSSEKQEDTNSYLIKCYDKMLYSMVDYESFATYPITIRDYLDALCTHLGLVFKNKNDYFTNYDKTIENELYLDKNGNSLGYKFRDVLDELAQVTGSIICINEEDDELEIRYPSDAGAIRTSVSGKDLTLANVDDIKVDDIELTGETTQETTTGKNLFYIAPQTLNGVTLSYASDGAIILNGKSNASFTAFRGNINVSGNYTLSVKPSATQSSTYIRTRNSSSTIVHNIQLNSTSQQTTTSNSQLSYVEITIGDTNITYNNLKIYAQLESGGSATTFEKATLGASPNPNYPQEVKTVTGLQEIKTCGKNLFNEEVAKTTGSPGNKATLMTIQLEPNTQYTFTRYVKTNFAKDDGYYLYFVKNEDTNTRIFDLMYSTMSNPINNGNSTITTGSSGIIKLIGVYATNQRVSTYFANVNVQIEKGSSSTDYEPYQEQVSEINLGKNLINPNSAYTGTSNGITTTYNADQSLSYSGTTTSTWAYLTNKISTSLKAGNYTFSRSKSLAYTTIIRLYRDASNYQDVTILANTTSRSASVTNDIISYQIYIAGLTSATELNDTLYCQLEAGSQATTYSPYFTPIELCKIGTYEDKIFKTTGKNLLDISKIEIGKTWSGVANTQRATILWLPIKANQQYNFVSSWTNSSITNIRVVLNHGSSDQTNNLVVSSFPFTNTTWEYASVEVIANTTFTETMLQNVYVMLCEGTNTEYEPYSNNEWYVKKNIGKVVLNGSEFWAKRTDISGLTNTSCFRGSYSDEVNNNALQNTPQISNYFTCLNNTTDVEHIRYTGTTNYRFQVFINKSRLTTDDATGFKSWLSTNNTIVYYVLASPTYEKLNDTLQSQLSNILLLEGLNNVITSVPINLNYVSDMDTIDEEFFDENNVNFGEVYGPVNTIILSRSAESDELAKSLVENEEDRIAIKISDNQILNFDGREEYLDGLLNRLSGTMYVQNDYTSKGICYYNIGDRYKAYIFGKYYRCLMLNDDVTIESGLSENVSTEIPETAETDYSKTSTSDKTVRKANLIVDKQLGEIRGEVEDLETSINGDNGLATRMTRAETKLDSQQATLTFIEENTLNEDGSVKAVSTSTNYKFDADGMKIGKSTDDFNSLQDNTGTFYYEKDTMTGKYTKDGGVFKDLGLYGKYYYGIDAENFDVATFTRDDALFLAQMYTDSEGEECFGHFYNGN